MHKQIVEGIEIFGANDLLTNSPHTARKGEGISHLLYVSTPLCCWERIFCQYA